MGEGERIYTLVSAGGPLIRCVAWKGWYLTSLLDERRTIRICHSQGTSELCDSQVGSHDDLKTVPPVEVAFEELRVLDGLFCRVD